MEQRLLTLQLVAQCRARQLANIMHTCAQLHRPSVVVQLWPAFVSKLDQADPQAIANTLWAVATMGQQAPPQQLQHLLTALVSTQQQANSQEIANSLWAVATMGQQVPPQQLQQLLAVLYSKLQQADPQNIANSLWAVAKLEQQVPSQQLQQLLAVLDSKLQQATPHEIASSLWAVSDMQQQQHLSAGKEQELMSDIQLEVLVGSLAAQLQHAKPQEVSNTLLACARFRFVPTQLLAALEDGQQLDMLSGMTSQELANSAWACGLLGYSSSRLPGAFLQHAASQLAQQGQRHRFNAQELSNLCWSAAVLDLQQCMPDVLLLVRAASEQWDSMHREEQQQLYQVHLWLLDCGLPATLGQQRLSGCLTAQQLQQCRASWEQALDDNIAVANTSQLQRSVFKALQQLPASAWQRVPASAWQRVPAMEQRTADGAFSIDMAAVTAAGQQLAIEVDGPSHFVRPDPALNGPTQSRNRALACSAQRALVAMGRAHSSAAEV